MVKFYTLQRRLRVFIGIGLSLAVVPVYAQDTLRTAVKSYHAYPAPLIEDNSFLIEEAFNQGAGVVQFISTGYLPNLKTGDIAGSFTHEMPLKGVKHQFSYTLNYYLTGSQAPISQGLGDVLLNYRYELQGKDNWALITPRISLILPTGDVSKGFGLGAWGSQINLPVTKMVASKVVTHYNAGFTFYNNAVFNLTDENGQSTRKYRDLTHVNLGGSLIWMPVSQVNVLVEYVSNLYEAFSETGSVFRNHQMLINPGLRYAFSKGVCQFVPGLGLPVTVENRTAQVGAFFYLSIEPDYSSKK